jgi:hypothetical protein
MSTLRRCASCVYMVLARPSKAPEDREPRGYCQRMPPTVVNYRDKLVSIFPYVHPAGWCGEYEEKKTQD